MNPLTITLVLNYWSLPFWLRMVIGGGYGYVAGTCGGWMGFMIGVPCYALLMWLFVRVEQSYRLARNIDQVLQRTSELENSA